MNGRPGFREALKLWLHIGFISFGGPAGQIAILHKEVVERRRWIDEARFTSGLSFCTFLPGPEAQQLATYIGWSLHGYAGGIAAGVLFFLPAVFLLLFLSFIRAEYGNVPIVAGILWALRATVVAILCDAVLGMSRRRIVSRGGALLAGLAFVATFVLRVPFPLVVGGAALVGLIAPRFAAKPAAAASFDTTRQPDTSTGFVRLATVIGCGVFLWALPWLALLPAGETAALFRTEYVFFTQSALVTFGGAYAVLSYVTQAAVEQFHWLSRAEVIDGLALAETTPGPLIIVLQYVGFLAAWNEPHGLPRALAGTIGALLTTYATFLPSIVLVLSGAPFVERLTSMRRVGGSLAAITAAVTGVIASLGLDYGVAVALPANAGPGVDLAALVLVAVFFTALRRGAGFGPVLGAGAATGVLRHFLS
jgi:chromate transporter